PEGGEEVPLPHPEAAVDVAAPPPAPPADEGAEPPHHPAPLPPVQLRRQRLQPLACPLLRGTLRPVVPETLLREARRRNEPAHEGLHVRARGDRGDQLVER